MYLVHYSRQPDLSQVNPCYHGTGLRGAERKRKEAYPNLYHDRSYFGTTKYRKEVGLGNHKYSVEIDDNNICTDFTSVILAAKQKMNELQLIGQDALLTLVENCIKDDGYIGYQVGEVVALFEPIPVQKEN